MPHLKTQNVNVPHQPNVITFNLKFLSTSAPLKETINITLDRIYHQREINTSISKKNMHNLLLCTKTVYFCFNGKIYYQNYGVAVGPSLGSVLVDTVMVELEKGVIPMTT